MIRVYDDDGYLFNEDMRRLYADAVQVLDACNLSGVVNSLSGAMTEITHELEMNGKFSTEARNRHPVARLFIEKMTELNCNGHICEAEYGPGDHSFIDALELCRRRANLNVPEKTDLPERE